MQYKKIMLVLVCLSSPLYADQEEQLHQQIMQLQKQAQQLQTQLGALQKKLVVQKGKTTIKKEKKTVNKPEENNANKSEKAKYHSSKITVHTPEEHPESIGFSPTALVADNRVLTYIAGTPVVTSPYLGARPEWHLLKK